MTPSIHTSGWRYLLAAILILIFAYLAVVSADYDQTYLRHELPAMELGAEHNLLSQTTKRKLNYYDAARNAVVNKGAGLMTAGPSIFLQKGRYRVTFDMDLIHVDPHQPEITFDIYRIRRDWTTERLAHRVMDAENGTGHPTIEFRTPGGVGHEFALFVSSPHTKVALKDIRLQPVRLSYGPYIIKMIVWLALLILLVFAFKKLDAHLSMPSHKHDVLDRLRTMTSTKRGLALFAVLFGLYAIVIFQPFWPLNPIALTGDAPNYVILANYFAKYHTFHISSIAKVYDVASYYPLIGFRVFDPHTHIHAVAGHIYPHHQHGYSALIAILFVLGLRSIQAVMLLSALSVSIGMVFVYKILLKTDNRPRALLLTVLVALSPPVLFYSFAVFTEVIAFPIVAMAFYYLVLDRTSQAKQFLAVTLLGLLLLVNFKYIFVGLPIVVSGLLRPDRRALKAAKASLFVFLVLLYEGYVKASTGSFNPLAWYRSMHPGQFHLAAKMKLAPVLSLGYLVDQRFGIFLVAPFTLLLLAALRSRIQQVAQKSAPILTALAAIVLYLGVYSTSGFGGTSPVLRPQMAVWALIVFAVFSVRIDLKSLITRSLLAISVAFGVLMLATGFFMANYTENYSKFYESLTPYRFKLQRHLPNVTTAWQRVRLSVKPVRRLPTSANKNEPQDDQPSPVSHPSPHPRAELTTGAQRDQKTVDSKAVRTPPQTPGPAASPLQAAGGTAPRPGPSSRPGWSPRAAGPGPTGKGLTNPTGSSARPGAAASPHRRGPSLHRPSHR